MVVEVSPTSRRGSMKASYMKNSKPKKKLMSQKVALEVMSPIDENTNIS